MECVVERNVKRLVVALVVGLAVAPAVAAQDKKHYRVVGRILQSDGTPFCEAIPVIFLNGAYTPFHAQASVGSDGSFKFGKIPPGTYTLAAAVPRRGEMRRTIEVGPGFADSKGNVIADIAFDRTVSLKKKDTVSAAELSVSESALREFRKAQDCLSRRDVPGAIERLKKAVELSPQFAVAWNLLGTIAYQTGKFEQAEDYFRRALQQDSDLYAPLVNLGGALLALKRDQEALDVNLNAVKTMPGDALAHAQLGKNYYYLGRLDEAETHLKRAKTLDPSHFSCPQIVLIEIYVKRNQLRAAIAETEEFLKLHPDSEYVPRLRQLLEAARAHLSATP
jgi:Tfp pilus assembly protein PilF